MMKLTKLPVFHVYSSTSEGDCCFFFPIIKFHTYWKVPTSCRIFIIIKVSGPRTIPIMPTNLKPMYIVSNVNNGLIPILDDKILDRKSTRLNSSHVAISYAVFCLKKKKKKTKRRKIG